MTHHQGHPYRLGTRGRSVVSLPSAGGLVVKLACSGCPTVGERNMRVLMPPEQIDKKFAQAGWKLDPHLCPNCQALAAEEKAQMASAPSPAAIAAQARMFKLLDEHFDPEKGAFRAEWNDKRIADETGMKPETVAAFRKAAFGEIKEDPALAALRADINALEALQRETAASVAQDIAALRGRLAKLSGDANG